MRSALKKHKRATIALGTIVEVTLWLRPEQDEHLAFKRAYQAIRDVHANMSVHEDSSDLGQYRLAADNVAVPMSAATLEVLRFSEALFQQSHGFFDVCIGASLANAAYLPAAFLAGARRHQVRRDTLAITQTDAAGNGFVKKMPNTMIDLGGVAKGYAVDRAIDALKSCDVPAALVNAGGDMRIYGEVASPVHIRSHETYTFLKEIQNCALASSGMPTNLAQPMKVLPIVNPVTGDCLPASPRLMSIEAKEAMVADALTKLAWLDALDEPLLNRYNAELLVSS